VRTRDITRNRQPKAGASFVLITRVIESEKWLEYFLAQIRRNARTVVIDGDREIAMVAMTYDRDRCSKSRRIRYEIAEAALEGRRANSDDRWSVKNDACFMSVTLGIDS
jgi:hypothetical protein